MLLFCNLVCVVIGLVYGQETRPLLRTNSTTLPSISTTELPTSTLLSTSPSESPANTTTEVPTTTQAPITTKPPRPDEGSWTVTEKNVTCIRADLAIEFEIPSQNATIFLSPNATSTRSSCSLSNTTQALILEYDDYILTFEFEKDATSTYVRNVSFIYSSFRPDVFYNDTKLFLVKNGNSYLCKTTDFIHLGNATMYIYTIQLQAFATADETGFGKIEECELDDLVNDIIPIAVACALAGLTILVLIVYLIMRKSPQRGYTSV
ncbi:hypothetical protein JTE90_024921 [Oedothorax gibbosus]|uniref:Lysosome-associated membrane glycoprotein 5 n=1 Tax=Oedothorax gibbosus TaxID=931172 RepID=A0AAV6TYD1_9ARAC|nr:hypothetical protein JTE90_024921 [Oedothorax gibbosus]